jgi:L-serine dehydratase
MPSSAIPSHTQCAHTIQLHELFKVGIGPSSSHTTGPMVAAKRFVDGLSPAVFGSTSRIVVTLFGSLACTGSGHGTPGAVILGLSGQQPDLIDPSLVPSLLAEVHSRQTISLAGRREIAFTAETDIAFDILTIVDRHPNALRFRAFDDAGSVVQSELWFSVGGGFVERDGDDLDVASVVVPYPFSTGRELLDQCERAQCGIPEVVAANETAASNAGDPEIDHLVNVMMQSIDLGLAAEGLLPGSLGVRRRAKDLYNSMTHDDSVGDQLIRVATYAMAVNEQNAAGQRVVTAPTNGAAGVIPAVLRHLRDERPAEFLLHARAFMRTAAAIGSIIKQNASISGAEVGCQGEVGSASAMAAAGLCCALGGTNDQIEHAAEIALEHHLGMTCDPVAGLVQIPCIERNGFGATKAVLAAHMALRGGGEHLVSLDQVVVTMRETGRDMHTNYRETSRGGLAVNVPNC